MLPFFCEVGSEGPLLLPPGAWPKPQMKISPGLHVKISVATCKKRRSKNPDNGPGFQKKGRRPWGKLLCKEGGSKHLRIHFQKNEAKLSGVYRQIQTKPQRDKCRPILSKTSIGPTVKPIFCRAGGLRKIGATGGFLGLGR